MTDTIDSPVAGPVFPFPRPSASPLDLSPDYRRLQVEEPASRAVTWNGDAVWLITRFEDVKMVLRDPRFSADNTKPGFPGHTSASEEITRRFLPRMDPPEHTVLRKLLMPEFAPPRMRALTPRVHALIDQLLDEMLEVGPPADFVASFAMRVPSMVVCEMLGVPFADHELFHRCVSLGFGSATSQEQAAAANAEFVAYLDGLVRQKERDSPDDALGRLADSCVHTGKLTHEELVDLARLLVIAGFDTTGNTIALGTVALLENPSQLRALRDDPGLVNDAVEEILRYTSITHSGRRRVALDDVEIGGRLIRAGDAVVAAENVANRDATAFPDPDRFDIRRRARHQIAFSFGPHACAGGPLARMELKAVFSTLFKRIPTLSLAEPLQRLRFKHDSQIYGLYELPVRW